MFVKMRMSAHEALKQYMLNDHAPLDGDTSKLIYDIISKSETSDSFALALDFVCSKQFVDETSDGLDDLIRLILDMPEELDELLNRYSVN